jgi:16S rRNA (cytosine967-C5)-methyltransferase
MTPAARLSAAIDILDRILAGSPAEQALTNWGRASRFAGSGDRNAVRDIVYDALRCQRSFAALGGGLTGRGLVLGSLRDKGADVGALFNGEGHAPSPITEQDQGTTPQSYAALDCPDWLGPLLQDSLGADFAPVLMALRHRAPVFLRTNLARGSRDQAITALAAEGIVAQPHDLAKTALEVTENARKIQNSQAYLQGLVELQDAASQAVVAAIPLNDGQRVLDHCAGGGGKTLALAAQARIQTYAHDADPRRMRDLPDRAKRAGVKVIIAENPEKTAPYDVILTDVPCSGSGSWRRDPQGKWALTPADLARLCTIQAGILDRAAPMVAVHGHLAYATCSMLQAENEAQVSGFLLRHPQWRLLTQRRFSPLQGGDGFYFALLTRDD